MNKTHIPKERNTREGIAATRINDANARLIAAAPEMFRKLVEYAQAFPDEEALAIIAKVEGNP